MNEENMINVGIVQFKRNDEEPDINVERLKEILEDAKDLDMVFLSENWLSNEPVDLLVYMNVVEELSRKVPGTFIFSGCQYTALGNTIRSIGLVAIDGESRISCEKIYPSHAVGERGRISPGVYIDPILTKKGNVGCIACVDVMYPEISRLHALSDAIILYNPASMPYDRLELWHSLGVARAAENQVFFIGVNTLGTRYVDGRPTTGGSFIVDPSGTFILNLTDEEGLFKAELYIEDIYSIRNRRKYLDDVKETIAPFYDRFRFMLTHR